MNKKYQPFDINRKKKEDLEYIRNEIITDISSYGIKPKYYMKYSRLLKAFSILDLTQKQYINFWKSVYKSYPEEWKEILQAIEDKFSNGLTSKENMIKLINNSHDSKIEKRRALIALDVRKDMYYGNEEDKKRRNSPPYKGCEGWEERILSRMDFTIR